VVKVDGPAHKGSGVVLGIDSRQAAADAARELGGRVLVARQVAAGLEVLCGVARDPLYGPLVAVGIGGAAVEALSLTAVALAPLDRDAALELVDEAPGPAGVASPAAREALAATLVALRRPRLAPPDVAAAD